MLVTMPCDNSGDSGDMSSVQGSEVFLRTSTPILQRARPSRFYYCTRAPSRFRIDSASIPQMMSWWLAATVVAVTVAGCHGG